MAENGHNMAENGHNMAEDGHKGARSRSSTNVREDLEVEDFAPMAEEHLSYPFHYGYDSSWEKDPYKASPQSRYEKYGVKVDHEAGDRGMEIQLLSLQRPHMRALHTAWISFFLAFAVWFAMAPLLVEIQKTLKLSKKEVWTSSIASDFTTIFARMVIGPFCDIYGPRIPMAIVLCVAAVPCAMTGLVQSASGLAVLRFFIGIAGSSFVMAQFWPTRMFAREIAGTANGLVGGWGNLGGAVSQIVMGSILFPVFRDQVFDGDAEKSWRTICIIPAAIALLWGLCLPFISDDAPMGNYVEMRKRGAMDQIYFTTSLRSGATKNTWILYCQYACSFGVELVMNNAAVLYFTSEFGQTTEQAAAIGSIFGWMNVFARVLGGLFSDRLNLDMGMRGRLWLQTILLVLEGSTIIVFAYCETLIGAIVTMSIFSIFTQASEGAIYGVVPYVSKLYTGSVSGLVGAGGNAGSVVFGFGFRSLSYRNAFLMTGIIVIVSSFLSFFINIPCHAGLISGEDNVAVIQARQRHISRVEGEEQQRQEQDTEPEGEGALPEAGHREPSVPRREDGAPDSDQNQVPQIVEFGLPEDDFGENSISMENETPGSDQNQVLQTVEFAFGPNDSDDPLRT